MSETTARPRIYWLLTSLVLLASAALRFYDLGGPGLWIDEVFTDLYARLPVRDMLEYLRDDSVQMPFYYLSLHAYPIGSEFLIRSYSVILGMLSVLILIVMTERTTGDWQLAVLAGALLAVSPLHVGISRTARMYATVSFLSLVVTYLFMRLIRGKGTTRDWLLFTVCSTALYLTHYFTAAVPLAQYMTLGLMLKRRRSIFRKWIIAQMIAVMPVLVWFGYLSQNDNLSVPIGSLLDPKLKDLFLTVEHMSVGFRWDSFPWYAWPGLIVALVGLGAGFVSAVRHRRDDVTGWYWGSIVILTPVLAWIASKIFTPVYMDRYFTPLLPGVLILIVMGWRALAQNRSRYIYWAATGLVILTGASQTVQLLADDAQYKEGWSDAIAYIEAHAQPGDGVAPATSVELLALKYYTDLDVAYSWLREPERAVVEPFNRPVSRVWILVRMGETTPHYTQWVTPSTAAGFPIPDDMLVPFVADRRDHVIDQRTFNGIALFLIDTSAEADDLAR